MEKSLLARFILDSTKKGQFNDIQINYYREAFENELGSIRSIKNIKWQHLSQIKSEKCLILIDKN